MDFDLSEQIVQSSDGGSGFFFTLQLIECHRRKDQVTRMRGHFLILCQGFILSKGGYGISVITGSVLCDAQCVEDMRFIRGKLHGLFGFIESRGIFLFGVTRVSYRFPTGIVQLLDGKFITQLFNSTT